MEITIGIVGGAGYAAGELIRLLMQHPHAQIQWVHSESNAGEAVCNIHKDLLGELDLRFVHTIDDNIDLLFICSGHGNTAPFLEQHNFIHSPTKIIALSRDFRLSDGLNPTHDFVYGLTELHRERIKKAKHIANPGCFATAIQLALMPLAAKNLLKNPVHINGIIGTTGAGQRPRFSTHFSWVDNNVSIFKPFEHQHLEEIKQGLSEIQKEPLSPLHFIPVRGNFSRGIFVTAYTEFDGIIEEVEKWYKEFYHDDCFVHLSPIVIDLKQVLNTNKCILQLQIHEGKLLITTIIDNLIKGAAGQAIQNMNLMFGLPENTGLMLKGSAF